MALKQPKIMYIFQLMCVSSGGTAKASTQFQNQFDAVDSETALARMRVGYISDGYVQLTGPIVVAKTDTNR